MLQTIFEDGLQIPFVKLYDQGKYNEAMVDIFRRNSRIPEWFDSDLTALVAACKTASVRVTELCDRYGWEIYYAACEDLLIRNKTAIGHIIDTKIGFDRSFFTDFIDDNGKTEEQHLGRRIATDNLAGHGEGPLNISCAMYREGHKLVFDWDGTAPQANSSVNYYLSTTMFRMFIGYFLLAVYDPHAVVNDGFHELIDVRIPEGSILRPVRPAAISCRTHLLGRVMDVIQALMGQRNPAFRSAAGFSDSPHLFYSGFKPNGEC